MSWVCGQIRGHQGWWCGDTGRDGGARDVAVMVASVTMAVSMVLRSSSMILLLECCSVKKIYIDLKLQKKKYFWCNIRSRFHSAPKTVNLDLRWSSENLSVASEATDPPN